MRLVVAGALDVGLVHGKAEAGTGHEVVEGAVVAGAIADAVRRDAAQAHLLSDGNQLVQQGGGIWQAVVVQFDEHPVRAKGVPVAARGVDGGLAPVREEEPHHASAASAGEQDQAIGLSGQVAPGDDRSIGTGEIGVSEQAAEAGVAGRVFGQRDKVREVRGAGRMRWETEDRLGDGQLHADDGREIVHRARGLEADDASEGHVVGERKGGHAERRRTRHQGLG